MRLRRVLAGGGAVVVVAFGLSTWGLFLRPLPGPPARADAVVALAGEPGRVEEARRLHDRGVAPVLLISDPEGSAGCAGRSDAGVVCFAPDPADPADTVGEARALAVLARDLGLDELVVVTSRTHVPRASRLVARCTGATVHAVAVPERGGLAGRLRLLAKEWVGVVWVTVSRRC